MIVYLDLEPELDDMEADQEELVSMIFGDDPPENWRENPEFQLYLVTVNQNPVYY